MRLLAFIALLLAAPALAQQPTAEPNPTIQALSDKLIAELNENVQLRAIIVDLKRQLDTKAKEPAKK